MYSLIVGVAKYLLIVPVVGIIWLWFRLAKDKRLELIGLAVIGGVLALGLSRVAAKLFYDPRPFVEGGFKPLISHAADNGFPSDHTLLSAFLGYLAYRYNRQLGGVLLIVALLVGLGRMAAGVHHSWDILGSLAIAFVGIWLAIKIYTLLRPHLPAYLKGAANNS